MCVPARTWRRPCGVCTGEPTEAHRLGLTREAGRAREVPGCGVEGPRASSPGHSHVSCSWHHPLCLCYKK